MTTPVPHADRDASELPGSRIDSVPPPAEDPFFVNGDTGQALLPAYFEGTPRPVRQPFRCPSPGEHDELAWFHAELERKNKEISALLSELSDARAIAAEWRRRYLNVPVGVRAAREPEQIQHTAKVVKWGLS